MPVIDSLSDVIYPFRYCGYIPRQSRRCSSSLLLDSGQYRIRTESRLDQPAVQHHISNDWEDVRYLFNITASRAVIVLRNWFLYVNIVLNFLLGSLTAIFTFAQCNPPRVLWEGTKNLPHAKCWDPKSQLEFCIFSRKRFENNCGM